MTRGRFIALEGIDGSGTTSQVSAVADALRTGGTRVFETFEPSSRAIGRNVRERLAPGASAIDPGALALLFAADRLDHVAAEIEPALRRGETVVCDRYVLSSWAYQALDNDLAWVQAINARAPWPELTIMLDVSPEVALDRIARRQGDARDLFETEELQRRVASAYEEAISLAPAPVIRIAANAPPATVTAAILRALERA